MDGGRGVRGSLMHTCSVTFDPVKEKLFFMGVKGHIIYTSIEYNGLLVTICTFVCLTLLASFFLPSHLSFKNMYIYIHVYTCRCMNIIFIHILCN